MIELNEDRLEFSFPEVHPEARLTIEFQRTLRIPDDDRAYSLPPGLGSFELCHVDDHAANVPAQWIKRGGVMLPMYQSEAMWLNFDSETISGHDVSYPFAIKIATGKQCAISGQGWREGLCANPQDYVVAPEQPWLDGFVVDKGIIRQFVAMPLGSGYSAEEQITGKAEHGGLQIAVYPMKREAFEKRFPKQPPRDSVKMMADMSMDCCYSMAEPAMGIAPGGRMKQEIYDDPYDMKDWATDVSSRCFVHLCNSMVWQSITGSLPHHPAPTAKRYTDAGLPWYEYYDETLNAVKATSVLSGLQSIWQKATKTGEKPLPENESVNPINVTTYQKGLVPGQVREGQF